jgi:urea transport system substrate-binding protein
LAGLVAALWLFASGCNRAPEPIKIGILHSLTGALAPVETPVVDATRFAIEEINEQGGVMGRVLDPVIVDGRSTPAGYVEGATTLLGTDRVVAVFGGYTSPQRKALLPVLQKYDALMFYPVRYEGLEQSANVVYTGAAPNQQYAPVVRWALKTLGPRVAIVGADTPASRVVAEIIADQVRALHGVLVAEQTIAPTGSALKALSTIRAREPNVVFNLLEGSLASRFFDAMADSALTVEELPNVCFGLGENEVKLMSMRGLAGHYVARNYFQQIDTAANRAFVQRFRARFGDDRVLDDPMAAAYIGVHLWARTVAFVKTTDPVQVRAQLHEVTYDGPGGPAYIDPETHHTWLPVYVTRVRKDGQFEIVWSGGGKLIRPVPFPAARPEEFWRFFAGELHAGRPPPAWDRARNMALPPEDLAATPTPAAVPTPAEKAAPEVTPGPEVKR